MRPERWKGTAKRLLVDSWRRKGGKSVVTGAVTATAKAGRDADDPQTKDESRRREQRLQFARLPGPSLGCSIYAVSLCASNTSPHLYDGYCCPPFHPLRSPAWLQEPPGIRDQEKVVQGVSFGRRQASGSPERLDLRSAAAQPTASSEAGCISVHPQK